MMRQLPRHWLVKKAKQPLPEAMESPGFAAQNYINLSKTIFMHSTCTGCLKWRKLGSFQLDARLNGATLS